jgi:hypothetical protein
LRTASAAAVVPGEYVVLNIRLLDLHSTIIFLASWWVMRASLARMTKISAARITQSRVQKRTIVGDYRSSYLSGIFRSASEMFFCVSSLLFAIPILTASALRLEFTTAVATNYNFELYLIDTWGNLSTTFNFQGWQTALYYRPYSGAYQYQLLSQGKTASTNYYYGYTQFQQVDPHTVKVINRIGNPSATPAPFTSQHLGDIAIGGHLCPHVQQFGNGTGFSIISGNISLSLIGRNSPHVTDVYSYWFGDF